MSDLTKDIPKGTLTKEETIAYLIEIDNRFCIEPCVMRNAIYSACHYLDDESAKEPQEEPKCSECTRESIQAECVLDGCKFHAKEPQGCKWYKGINSVETCWGDIDIKTFNKFKRQGAKFCPYCGRKIKVEEWRD